MIRIYFFIFIKSFIFTMKVHSNFVILSLVFYYIYAGEIISDFKQDEIKSNLDYNETLSPLIVTLLPLSSCSISVSWNCVECISFNVLNYIVYWGENGEQEIEKNVFNYVIEGLQADSPYEVYVSAVYEEDLEYASNSSVISTDPGDPPRIINITVIDVTETSCFLTWETTTIDCPIKEYNVTWIGEVLCDAGKMDFGLDISLEKSISINYLSSYTNYSIGIVAVSSDGRIGEASAVQVITNEAEPGKPESVTSRVISESSIEISWVPPLECNGILKHYIVSWKLMPDESSTGSLNVSETVVEISDLLACGDYEFSVQATTSAGAGDKATTNNKTFPEVPPPLTNLDSSDITSKSVHFTWTPPDTHCPVLNYVLDGTGTVLWNEGSYKVYANISGNNSFYELQDLVPWTDYSICFAAVTEAVPGNSTCSDVQTLEDVPGSPTNLAVQEDKITASGFSITWNEPVVKNGILKGFKIILNNENPEYMEYDESNANYVFSFDNLIARTHYSVNVSADTKKGYGLPAETATDTKDDITSGNSDDDNNLGLILGITIPLVIVLVALGLLGFYYRVNINERLRRDKRT